MCSLSQDDNKVFVDFGVCSSLKCFVLKLVREEREQISTTGDLTSLLTVEHSIIHLFSWNDLLTLLPICGSDTIKYNTMIISISWTKMKLLQT